MIAPGRVSELSYVDSGIGRILQAPDLPLIAPVVARSCVRAVVYVYQRLAARTEGLRNP